MRQDVRPLGGCSTEHASESYTIIQHTILVDSLTLRMRYVLRRSGKTFKGRAASLNVNTVAS